MLRGAFACWADALGDSDDRAMAAAGGGAGRRRRRGEDSDDAAGGAKHKKSRSVRPHLSEGWNTKRGRRLKKRKQHVRSHLMLLLGS